MLVKLVLETCERKQLNSLRVETFKTSVSKYLYQLTQFV